jgi:tetratricopeptide (TPR) repeat protein
MHSSRFSRVATLTLALIGTAPLGSASAAPGVEELRSSARKPPKEPAAALDLARALRRAGLLAEAASVARSGFGQPGETEIVAQLRLELARTFIDQREYKKASNECAQITKLSKWIEQLCVAEVQLFGRRGSLALPAAEEVLAQSPGQVDALVAKGRALHQLGQSDQAESALKEAIASGKRSAAYRFLSELYVDRGQADKALATLKSGRQSDPEDPDVLALLGQVLPPTAEARDVLERALSIRPSFARARARLGEVLLALGQLDPAEASLRDALKIDPKQADWHATLGRVYLQKKRPDDALKAARDALKIVGNHGESKLVEARALSDKGQVDEAIAAFESAWGLARSNPEVLVEAARACLKHGRPTTAQAFAERATQEFPDWGPAWETAGDIARLAGERDGARRAYQKALSAKGPVDKAAVRRKLAELK